MATVGRADQSGFCSVLTIFRYSCYVDDDVDDDVDCGDDDDDETWNVMML